MKHKSLIVAAGICAASLTSALGVTSVTTFGSMPGETFGGSGIPNDAVQQTTISGLIGPYGSSIITLGLTATPRFTPGELANDGAGTFFASTSSQWNFDFVASIANGGDLSSYKFILFYDLDPATGNSLSSLGQWNLDAGQPQGTTSVHNSEYPGFAFLANGVAGAVTPPTGGFTYNINAPGEYTFALGVFNGDGAQIGDLDKINVRVDSVPDATSTAGLMAISAFGLFALKRHTAKRQLAVAKKIA
jgi:hypothetical protein